MTEMLHEGRMPLNDAEHKAIDKLGSAVVSFTRTQPGETGPLHVTVGDEVYEVAEDGTTVKVDG